MGGTRIVPLMIVLGAAFLVGCAADDSPTAPTPSDQVVWNVPGDVPTIAAAADSARQGDLILVAPGTYLEHGIVLDIGVDLRGAADKADVVIDAQDRGRVVVARLREGTIPAAGDTVTSIADLTITGGRGDGLGGGGLLLKLAAEVSNVHFLANRSAGPGAGAYADGVRATFRQCTFEYNASTAVGAGGGGLAVFGAGELACTLEACGFRGNSAWGPGGGAFIDRADAAIDNCTFLENHLGERGYQGGGLAYAATGDQAAVVDSCSFLGNTSLDMGGGIGSAGPLTVTASTFAGNEALQGGAMQPGADWSIDGCTFMANEANHVNGDDGSGLGGALYLPAGTRTVSNCTFERNRAWEGSAVFGSANVAVQACTFVDNAAYGPGTVRWVGEASVSFLACTFSGNAAGAGGAFALNAGADAGFTGCTISGNSADSGGAGLVNAGATVVLTACTVTGNTAAAEGGAITAASWETFGRSGVSLTACTVTGNTAGSQAGAIFLGAYCDLAAGESDLLLNSAPAWACAFVANTSTATFTCCDVVPADVGGDGTITHVTEGCE